MKTTEIIRYGIADQKFESYIIERSTILKQTAIDAGIDQSALNLPSPDCTQDRSRPFIGLITQGFQLLLDENQKNFELDGQAEKVVRIKKDAKTELDALTKRKEEVETDIRIVSKETAKKETQALVQSLRKKEQVIKRWRPLIFLIVACDALVSSTLLQRLNYPLWIALLTGTAISSALLALTHIVPGWIHKATTRQQKITIALLTSLGVCIVFGIFASFREQATGNKYAFIIINYFTFFCASLIVYSKALTPDEKEQLGKHGIIQDKLDGLIKEKESIEKRESEIASSITKAEEEYVALSSYAEHLEKTIESQYQICYQHYCEQNIFHRSDKQVPRFFDDPAPSLQLHFGKMVKTICVLVGLLGMFACSPKEQRQDSILYDITQDEDPELVIDSESEIGRSDDIWQGRTVRFSTITDIDQNEVIELTLEEQIEFLSNSFDRQKEVDSFNTRLQRLCVTDTSLYNHSCVWIPTCQELSRLSKNNGAKSTLYLISDCKEHSDWVSLYDPVTIRYLNSNPKKIRQLFASKIPNEIRADSKVNLVIVHKPNGMEDNAQFRLIVDSLYRPILEDSLGIPITIKAKL